MNPSQGSDLPDVFPGQGNPAPCSGTADATIRALEVSKVGDANGDPIEPVELDPSSGLGLQITNAFLLSPDSHTFNLADNDSMTVTVAVGVNNPNVGENDYGDYEVKLAAKAPEFGIGVGNGLNFFLRLRALTATDTTPPVVSVTKPTGDEILGVIPIEVQAYDPDTLPIATGLASMSATVSSAGGTVSNLPILLTLDSSLAVGPGITVTGTVTQRITLPACSAAVLAATSFTLRQQMVRGTSATEQELQSEVRCGLYERIFNQSLPD